MFIFSCNNGNEKKVKEKAVIESIATESLKPDFYEVSTFESKDESGVIKGWGYDIYINGSRTIHQPTIPAVSGIHYFKTKEDAQNVGEFAMNKMKSTGSFPTLSLNELDSLGVTKNIK
jgi:hypothetical protein